MVAFLHGIPAGSPIIQSIKSPFRLGTERLHQAPASLRLSRRIEEARNG